MNQGSSKGSLDHIIFIHQQNAINSYVVIKCNFLSLKLFLALVTNDKKNRTIYEAENSYNFVFKHTYKHAYIHDLIYPGQNLAAKKLLWTCLIAN